MAKIPTILEAGRADGKLVTSDAIFDENKEMFQSEINDIQDTLNSDNPNKPLSAKQGKILKDLLDSKVIEAGSVPIDTEPIEGNITHLVNSDGLAKEFNKYNTEIILGGVYDISSHNNGIAFESLQDLLSSSNLSTLIPTSVRHGGMSIRFIQSSDNKYVQYRLMTNEFTTDATQWAIADEGVYVENSKFVYVQTDTDDKIIWAIKTDGSIYYGAGVPQQVKDYIAEKISSLSLDEYEDIVAFLSDYLGSDTTLKAMIDAQIGGINAQIESLDEDKLDAEGLDPNALSTVKIVESPEYIEVKIDSDNKVTEGVKVNGTKIINLPVEIQGLRQEVISNSVWIDVKVDSKGKLLEGYNLKGEKYFSIFPPQISEALKKLDDTAKNGYDVLRLYPKKDVLPILKNYKFTPRLGLPPDASYKTLSLLHFSDIHASTEQLSRMMEFYDAYKEYIDDALFTGDSPRYQVENTPTFNDYWAANGGGKVLFVIGNHDSYTDGSVDGIDEMHVGYSAKACYEMYLKPFLSETHLTEYVENKMYWVKDYPDSRIRLIAVDNIHSNETIPWNNGSTSTVYPDGGSVDTGEQLTWFAEKLDEAKEMKYHVICATHYPPRASRNSGEIINCTFTDLELGLERDQGGDGTGKISVFQQIVQDFINGGGKFICWLCGHEHTDMFFYDAVYNQLCVAIECCQRNLASIHGDKDTYLSSIPKIEGTRSQDLFNIFNVNPKLGYIRMFRFGAPYDRHGRRVESLVYDYVNKKLMYN